MDTRTNIVELKPASPIADNLQAEYRAAEVAVEDAMAKLSALVPALMASREQLGYGATVGAGVITQASKALGVMGEARQLLVDSHRELDVVGKRLNVRPSMTGAYKSDD
jgi:hypothetical protein